MGHLFKANSHLYEFHQAHYFEKQTRMYVSWGKELDSRADPSITSSAGAGLEKLTLLPFIFFHISTLVANS